MRNKTTSSRAICAVVSLTLQSESNRHRFMLRLILALIFSVLGLFQSDAMSSVVTPPTVPKSGLHSVSDKALTTSFTPVAKVTDSERYTIVHDYLGTPTQAYDSAGDLVWEMLLDVYGRVMECRGDRSLVPFRYQGQYEDAETGLYYNRFRYYSPEMGMYISSDPIGLAGNNPTLYGYVEDVNAWLDALGLHCSKKLAKNLIAHQIVRPPNTAAHHIVGSGKRAKPANDILMKYGIDVDSHVNGVFLPRNSNSSVPGLQHTGRHTNDYIDRVNMEIVAAEKIGGKDAVLNQLDQIRDKLLNGTYTPLQK